MAYDATFYSLLRNDRDDTARARVLDEWRRGQPSTVQDYCEEALYLLKNKWGLGENQAKALLCNFILFFHMKVDEQDKWRAHGESLRSEYEWMCVRRGIPVQVEENCDTLQVG